MRRIASLASHDGIPVRALGIDPDPRAIEVARARREPGAHKFPAAWRLEFEKADSRSLVSEGERFDVVISNHLLHHLSDRAFQGVLADSEALIDRNGLCVHSDIARSRLAYAMFSAASMPVSHGTFVRVDGLRSIRRSYTPSELADRLPNGWHAARVGPFRLLAIRSSASLSLSSPPPSVSSSLSLPSRPPRVSQTSAVRYENGERSA